MSFKIGDKVKMTKRGFRFYSNPEIAFDMSCVGGSIRTEDAFISTVCGLFAIHGVGTVKRFNYSDDPYIVFKYSLDGVNYKYTHYFDKKDVKKLSFIDRIIFKLKGLL